VGGEALIYVRFEVPTAVMMMMMMIKVFWNITPCCRMGPRRLRGYNPLKSQLPFTNSHDIMSQRA
jgi:hypothetical protein